MINLASRIKERMKAEGVTATMLAKHCDVAVPSVFGWLSGKTKQLSGMNLINASELLGVNPQWLHNGEGEMLRYKSNDENDISNKIVTNSETINTLSVNSSITMSRPDNQTIPVLTLGDARKMLNTPVLQIAAEQYTPYRGALSKDAWAAELTDSMMDDGTPQGFPVGTLIYVDKRIFDEYGKDVLNTKMSNYHAVSHNLTLSWLHEHFMYSFFPST